MKLSVLTLVHGIFFFGRKRKGKSKVEDVVEYDDLLCRFVKDGSGKKIGETISVDDDVLIIKSGSGFLGVPLKHVEEDGKTLLVKGLIDFDKAFEIGERWRRNAFRMLEEGEDGF